MRRLLSVWRYLRWIDASIQAVVDRGSAWCVHHGIPKSAQRYGLCVLAIASLVGRAAIDVATQADDALVHATITAVLAAVFTVVIVRQEAEDRAAERRGLVSPRDLRDASGPDWFWKIAFGVSLWISAGGLVIAGVTLVRILGVVGSLAWLVEVYLRASPRYPPPREETAPATLEPVRVKA